MRGRRCGGTGATNAERGDLSRDVDGAAGGVFITDRRVRAEFNVFLRVFFFRVGSRDDGKAVTLDCRILPGKHLLLVIIYLRISRRSELWRG